METHKTQQKQITHEKSTVNNKSINRSVNHGKKFIKLYKT